MPARFKWHHRTTTPAGVGVFSIYEKERHVATVDYKNGRYVLFQNGTLLGIFPSPIPLNKALARWLDLGRD